MTNTEIDQETYDMLKHISAKENVASTAILAKALRLYADNTKPYVLTDHYSPETIALIQQTIDSYDPATLIDADPKMLAEWANINLDE